MRNIFYDSLTKILDRGFSNTITILVSLTVHFGKILVFVRTHNIIRLQCL